MSCFVDLLAQGRIDMEPLISDVVAFDQAVDTYERMAAGELRGIGYLFSYPEEPSDTPRLLAAANEVPTPNRPVDPSPTVKLGLIGAGNYASSMPVSYTHLRAHETLR